ncbi:hypothetical protein KIH27_18625 [Mycobacterium sp. M1]|uniref:PRTRC system protein A n=1 Tax=Mycolicibacter acidiphilus TaxID=2835306 RepID=A0ABS5RMR9_9MYCO|nr:hypothetical protein [Mycolicibacter acidiphilus]MBS9535605.1 hypothetical protein [Mycolicibacter acidiphilus]
MHPHQPPEDPWWDYAHDAADALRHGVTPGEQLALGPILTPGETLRCTAELGYARLGPGATDRSRFTPPFLATTATGVLGAIAAERIVNNHRDKAANRAAQPTWRHQRTAAVLVTTDRLLCQRADAGYNSFWFHDVAEFHPDLPQRSVVLSFHDNHSAPLRLHGPAAPAVALWSAHALYGRRWEQDHRLAALAHPSAARAARDTATAYQTAAADAERRRTVLHDTAHHANQHRSEHTRERTDIHGYDGLSL